MRIQRKLASKVAKEPSEIVDLSLIEPVIKKYKNKKGSLIPILQGVQNIYNYIPKEAFYKIADETSYKLSDMYGVATFYAQFRLTPVGKYVIKVCHGTACHVQSAPAITTALKEHLKVGDGETTKDNLFTLESVACLGCCSLAPVLMIEDEFYGNLTGKSAVKVVRTIKRQDAKK